MTKFGHVRNQSITHQKCSSVGFTYKKDKLKGCPRITCQARMTLTFDLPERKFQMALIVIKENSYVKLF